MSKFDKRDFIYGGCAVAVGLLTWSLPWYTFMTIQAVVFVLAICLANE
jgi:hypothetical protein